MHREPGHAPDGETRGVTTDLLDVFVTGLDGRVYTAAWQPGDEGFRGWWPVGDLTVPQGASISAASRSADKMDVFATGLDANVYTAAWEPGDDGFRGWWPVARGQSRPGAPVAAVSRSMDLLDVFVAGLDGRVYTAAWQPGDEGFRGWWNIGSLVTGQTDPAVKQWTKVGTAYRSANSAHSEEAQGITTDNSVWFLASNGSKTLRKISNDARLIGDVVIPQGAKGAHVGAPGYFDGWIYVPVQRPYGVWKTTADLSRAEWWPVIVEGDQFPWCAVNPLNGRLYTSLSNATGMPLLFAYDRNTLQRRPEDDIRLQLGPIPLASVQGGHFTPRGRVLLCGSYPNRLFCYSSLTGYCFGAQQLGDYGSTGSEVESVTVRPWEFRGIQAPVHILELDNDWPSRDDCYLHSYSVPEPHRL